MTTSREAFEEKYQRSADDPTSAEMLAVWDAAWQAAVKQSLATAETLMPEPAFRLRWHAGRYTVSKPNIGSTDVYTADQMREAIRAATERAAKVCEAEAVDPVEGSDGDQAYNLAIRHCAAAIRGEGGADGR